MDKIDWNKYYVGLVGVLALLIILFYWMTRYYS